MLRVGGRGIPDLMELSLVVSLLLWIGFIRPTATYINVNLDEFLVRIFF